MTDTLEWVETTDKNNPGRHSTEQSFLVGSCRLWSHRSGMQTSWSLSCLNGESRFPHWSRDWGHRPNTNEVERLVAAHMAECPHQKAAS